MYTPTERWPRSFATMRPSHTPGMQVRCTEHMMLTHPRYASCILSAVSMAAFASRALSVCHNDLLCGAAAARHAQTAAHRYTYSDNQRGTPQAGRCCVGRPVPHLRCERVHECRLSQCWWAAVPCSVVEPLSASRTIQLWQVEFSGGRT